MSQADAEIPESFKHDPVKAMNLTQRARNQVAICYLDTILRPVVEHIFFEIIVQVDLWYKLEPKEATKSPNGGCSVHERHHYK